MQSSAWPIFRLALGAWLLALSQVAPAQTVLKIGYFDKDRSQFGTGASLFCDNLAKRTRGRYRCERLGDALGTAPELLEALRQGKLDAVNIPIEPLQSLLPELGLFDIPFLFRGEAHARRTLDGYIGHGLLVKLQGQGLVGLAWTELGLRHVSNSVRPVVTAADLKGLRLRTLDNPLQLAGYRTLQIEPSATPFPLLFDALEKRTLDGQENLIEVIVDAKFARVQQHLSLTGHLYAPGLILVSTSLWNQLSAEDKPRFVEAARYGASAQRRKISRENSVGLSVLKNNGMKIVTRVDADSFRNAMAPAYAEYVKTFGADTLAAVQAVK